MPFAARTVNRHKQLTKLTLQMNFKDYDSALFETRTEEISAAPVNYYSGDALISCDVCRRQNAPNRALCLYCGAALPVDETRLEQIDAAPVLRRLETFEKGWNIIYSPQTDEDLSDDNLRRASKPVGLDATELRQILDLRQIAPLARIESRRAAENLMTILRGQNLNVECVPDENLQPDVLPQRVRSLESIGAEAIKIRYAGCGDTATLAATDINLIVTGLLVNRKTTGYTARKSKNPVENADDSSENWNESLIDFYTTGNCVGYRISADKFDFSCLGAAKAMTAARNFQVLIERLRQIAAQARFVKQTRELRQALEFVWPSTERVESIGIKRTGVGRLSVGSRVTVSNADQFLRYSRLLRAQITESQD